MRRRRFVGACGSLIAASFIAEVHASTSSTRTPRQVGESQENRGGEHGDAAVETVASRSHRPVNVADFGAVPGMDCSSAVQRAIDHVESIGGYDLRDSGGTIEFGAGIWYFNNVVIQNSGIRLVGAGKRATLLANRDAAAPMLLIRQGDTSLTSTVADIDFENLQFRNTVQRSDGTPFLIQGNKVVGMSFLNVDFVSSPLAPRGNRNALRCDFLKVDTFQSRWTGCSFWGILGCAIELPDGPQSDTVRFENCIWAYCSLAGSFGLGSGSGINGLCFESCKVLGNQGGSYVSSGNDSFARATVAQSSTGTSITVSDGVNFRTNRAVVVGRSTNRAQYAFVRAVSGNVITLDRAVAVTSGDDVIHGQLGWVFGHVSMPLIQSSQLEGCDVGVYSVDGRQLELDSTVVASCARGILLNSDFGYLRVDLCLGDTIGRMKNNVAWQFITILHVSDARNVVEMNGTDASRSGYYKGNADSLVVNASGKPVRVLIAE